MAGMDILLKAMGIKPEQMKAQIEGVVIGIQNMLTSIDNRLKRIEKKLGIEEADKDGG